jgi:hypothetical protein
VDQAIAEANGDLVQAYGVWRRLNGLEQAPEFYDLDPDVHRSLVDGIPQGDAFEPFAQQRLWWWRWLDGDDTERARVFRPSADSNGVRNGDYGRILADRFVGVFDDSAFFYELGARIKGRRRWAFERPWPACSLHQRMFLACVWPSRRQPRLHVPGMGNDPRFRDILVPKANLALPDCVLHEQFSRYLEQQRRAAKMPPRANGGLQKPPAWNSVQYADLRWLKGDVLPAERRGQMNQSFRDYRRRCAAKRLAA